VSINCPITIIIIEENSLENEETYYIFIAAPTRPTFDPISCIGSNLLE